ncbi:unnamed protein product [Dovyalis caffra]|uniref:Uncharacterized protein n=1 Tax=Dovyalis caffra TaxID=77055 RepID=A0AAV1RX58_9ROSI|nr:unnamed protein product [Dovyalis caffra]
MNFTSANIASIKQIRGPVAVREANSSRSFQEQEVGHRVPCELVKVHWRDFAVHYKEAGCVEMIRRDLFTSHWKSYFERTNGFKPCYEGGTDGGERMLNDDGCTTTPLTDAIEKNLRCAWQKCALMAWPLIRHQPGKKDPTFLTREGIETTRVWDQTSIQGVVELAKQERTGNKSVHGNVFGDAAISKSLEHHRLLPLEAKFSLFVKDVYQKKDEMEIINLSSNSNCNAPNRAKTCLIFIQFDSGKIAWSVSMLVLAGNGISSKYGCVSYSSSYLRMSRLRGSNNGSLITTFVFF